MAEEKSDARTAVFCFPSAAGHINPSLPVCKQLVKMGWKVEYLVTTSFQPAIERTGATFRDRDAVVAEYGIEDVTAMYYKSIEEYGSAGAKMWALNFGSIAPSKLLPAYISFLRRVSPQLVVYCPVLSSVAHFAASYLGIPDVSLLTAAGPGFWDAAFAVHGGSAAGLVGSIKTNEANNKAIENIRSLLKKPELTLNTNTEEPLIHEYYTSRNLVSTVPFLADKLNDKDAAFYERAGQKFDFVGPLLDENQSTGSVLSSDSLIEDLFGRVEKALAVDQPVVYVSMGTVLTGDDPHHGWNSTDGTAISGKELFQSVFRGVSKVLGPSTNDKQSPLLSSLPLVIVSCGPQPDALVGLEVPDNFLCLKNVPQVQLLRLAKPALCVMNGGQNSFMEALSVGSPLVICPGFGDQPGNAAKAQKLELGLKVDRPAAAQLEGCADNTKIISVYQDAVADAICQVLGPKRQEFLSRARAVAEELKTAGGVQKAVDVLIEVAIDKK